MVSVPRGQGRLRILPLTAADRSRLQPLLTGEGFGIRDHRRRRVERTRLSGRKSSPSFLQSLSSLPGNSRALQESAGTRQGMTLVTPSCPQRSLACGCWDRFG